MPPRNKPPPANDEAAWELLVTREVVQRKGRRLRTYGSYKVIVDGQEHADLAGFMCEPPGPGDNTRAKSGKRIEAGLYPLWTQAGKYKSVGYSDNERVAGKPPMPALLLSPTGKRTGVLIHPAHPPKLYLSSIGCLNPTGPLSADQDIDFWDSRRRVIALIDSLKLYAPQAFAQKKRTRIEGAVVRIVGEPEPAARSMQATALSIASDAVLDAALPSLDELAERIAFCIGIWETNRAGTHPIPKESALDTVAGIKASFKTTNQATTPYAVDQLLLYPDLRELSKPPLTLKELSGAKRCCDAVVSLLIKVNAAVRSGTTSAPFMKDNKALVAATRLSSDDVATMFAAVPLKVTIDQLHRRVVAKTLSLPRAVASIPEASRLNLGPGSLKSYIRTPANWGENRAAWQRKAVAALSGDVVARIEQVAVSNDGRALFLPDVRSNLRHALAETPHPDLKSLVVAVSTKNNPREAGYGDNVYKIYRKLYLAGAKRRPPPPNPPREA